MTREVLRAGPLAQNEILKVKLVGKKSSQGIGLTVSPIDSSVIFSPLTETAIAAWNPSNNNQVVLAHDRDRLQFVADMTTTPHEPGVFYAVSSKFHRFFLKNLNPNEVNNRILRLPLPNGYSAPHSSSIDLHTINKASNYFGSPYKPNYLDKANVVSFGNYVYNSLHTPVKPQQPYNYETVGLVNFSLRNPFTALNAGESFPPRKEQRSNDQRPSFLDTLNKSEGVITSSDLRYLAPTTAIPKPTTQNSLHTAVLPFGSDYSLRRHLRNTEGQKVTDATDPTANKQ